MPPAPCVFVNAARDSLTTHGLQNRILEVDPPVWRSLLVPGDTTLGDLTFMLTNSHHHQFTIGGVDYSDPQFQLDDAEDEFGVTLVKAVPRERVLLELRYDFGNGWEHEFAVEKILPAESNTRYPVCAAGERAFPPEDCGGPWG